MVVLGSPNGGTAVLVDGNDVYFGDYGGAIEKLPLLGTSPVTAIGQPPAVDTNPRRLVAYGANLYWFSLNSGDLLTVPKAGGTPTVLVANDVANDLVLDGPYLYYSGNSGVTRYEIATGTITPVVAAGPLGLAVDSSYVYFGDVAGIERAPKDGTGSAQLLIPTGSVLGIAVDGQYVYWGTDGMGVFRQKNDGTGTADSLSMTAYNVNQVLVDVDGVYWSTANEVGWAPTGMTTGTKLVTGSFQGIALSSPAIYWTSFDTQKTLGFVARP
jgi:hypothetical protein